VESYLHTCVPENSADGKIDAVIDELVQLYLLPEIVKAVARKEKNMSRVQDIILSVPDVSCEHCVKTINGALRTLSGVEAVNTDIPTKTVHLRYQPDQLSREQIEQVLDEQGYTVAKGPQPQATPRMSGKPLNLL